MSRFGLVATVLIALGSAACSNSGSPYGAMVAASPADPVVAFANENCRSGDFTGHGMGMKRCEAHEEAVARAGGGAPYVAALR